MKIEPPTVIQGNCLDIMADMPDNSIDMVFVDSPYGHNNNNNDMIANREAIFKNKSGIKSVPKAEYRPILNDGVEADILFKKSIIEYARLLKPGGCCCCCCCGGGGPDPQFARWSLWLDKVIPFKMMVVWDKGKMGMGFHYRRSYETVLVAQKKGKKCNWYDNSHKIENIIRPGDYGIKKIIPTKRQHPTEKPVELATHFIKLHSKPGDVILDAFCGSGSTLEAGYMLDRQCIGIELDAKFVSMTNNRLIPIIAKKQFEQTYSAKLDISSIPNIYKKNLF